MLLTDAQVMFRYMNTYASIQTHTHTRMKTSVLVDGGHNDSIIVLQSAKFMIGVSDMHENDIDIYQNVSCMVGTATF